VWKVTTAHLFGENKLERESFTKENQCHGKRGENNINRRAKESMKVNNWRRGKRCYGHA
jgi:hypothetical protein